MARRFSVSHPGIFLFFLLGLVGVCQDLYLSSAWELGHYTLSTASFPILGNGFHGNSYQIYSVLKFFSSDFSSSSVLGRTSFFLSFCPGLLLPQCLWSLSDLWFFCLGEHLTNIFSPLFTWHGHLIHLGCRNSPTGHFSMGSSLGSSRLPWLGSGFEVNVLMETPALWWYSESGDGPVHLQRT